MAITRGTITRADQEFVETWENIAVYANGIIRLDARGDERPEIISNRRTFMITTEERMITQDRIVDPRNDPFLNGAFRPVVVPDTINIETNPNALSDEEIAGIFKASDIAFEEWLKTIDSPQTLRRMMDLAPDSDISLRRFQTIEARLAQVKPPTRIGTNDAHLASFLSDKPNDTADTGKTTGKTTGRPASAVKHERRGQGGRSSAYR